MIDIVAQVRKFNKEVVGVDIPEQPQFLKTQDAIWLTTALEEESQEFLDASTREQNETGGRITPGVRVVEQVDAIGDSIIFALGGFVRMGLSDAQILAVLHAIMDANFKKKAGVPEKRNIGAEVKDAIKPEGFEGPETRIAGLLGVHYYVK